jgi:hypothetical protein
MELAAVFGVVWTMFVILFIFSNNLGGSQSFIRVWLCIGISSLSRIAALLRILMRIHVL